MGCGGDGGESSYTAGGGAILYVVPGERQVVVFGEAQVCGSVVDDVM